MSESEVNGCMDESCRNFRAQTKQIIESGRYLERIYEFSEYEKAIECVRVLEEENRFFIQRFEKEQKDHAEMLQKLQAHLKLSEKNREIEKNRYKKKIDALKTELHRINQKPATQQNDLFSNSSDDQDEADDLDDDLNDKDDDVNFQEQSSTGVPLLSGHSMPAHNGENGPCKHSSDGQHPDFEFSDDSDFDMNEWEEDQNSKPKVVMRRRTAESKKNHSKGKKNKKN
ncbi:unnamed protein product [Oikopleura dioica]|uniref:Uncharacterized protein n=1 Tax=Oikopleura dioica TaxID=34765 RepID=E4Z676_OIKDI|nr:unnamed protein product [Oikopleura dioica]